MTAVPTAARTLTSEAQSLVLVPAPPAEASSWRRRFSRRVLAADTLVILGAVSIAAAIRWSSEIRVVDSVVAASLGVLWIATVLLSLRRLPHLIGAGADEFRRILSATVLTFGIASVASVLTRVDLPRMHVLVALPIGLCGMLAAHALTRGHLVRERRAGRALSRVIVLGRESDVSHVVSQIDRRRGRVEYDVVGVAVSSAGDQRSITVHGRTIPIVSAIDRVAQ